MIAALPARLSLKGWNEMASLLDEMDEAEFVEMFEQFWGSWPKDSIMVGGDMECFALGVEVGGYWLLAAVRIGSRKGITEVVCAIDPRQLIVADRLVIAELDSQFGGILFPLRKMRKMVRVEGLEPTDVCLAAIEELQKKIRHSPEKVLFNLRERSESGPHNSLAAVSGGLPSLGKKY